MSALPTRIERLLAQLFVHAARRIPPRCVARWAEALGAFSWCVLPVHSRLAAANIQVAFPNLDGGECAALARRSFSSFARTLIESVRMPCAVPEIFWEQDELLDAIAAGRNGIVLAAHIGNWELAAAAIAAAGACLHLVVASPTNALVARLMYRLRLSWGVTPHPRERSLRPVVQALKNGAFVGTAVDQWVSRKHVNAPFFDRQTPFASGLFELATRMAVPVFAISAIRENDSASARFHISAQVIWDGSDTTESVEKLVCRWAGVLEDTVQKHPEQYLWMHDRWKLKGKLK